MKILITGGLGFIGSHTVVELQQKGYKVVIIDDCSNSSKKVLTGIKNITGTTPEFEEIDLKNRTDVSLFFKKHNDITGVIHFAASKAVGESVQNPLKYYENNIGTLVYLLQEIEHKKEISFIFSSSCTVYGVADKFPITETSPVKPSESPYGNTKQIGEEILRDTCKTDTNLNAIALRYFNPIGGHESLEIGELPLGVPQNLIPYITQTGIGIRKELSVFGNDYDTHDGTCIRDYIHVTDLANAHLAALERLINKKNKEKFEVFNIGTGKGSTVLDVIKAFEAVSNKKLPYKFVDRRPGDVRAYYADTTLANEELGWKAKSNLNNAVKTAWEWEQKIQS